MRGVSGKWNPSLRSTSKKGPSADLPTDRAINLSFLSELGVDLRCKVG